jgi:hypothetical protein
VSVQGDDLAALQLALARLVAEVQEGSAQTVTAYTAMLETSVKRHASQPRTRLRPRGASIEGPRLLTGSYVASINRNVDRGVGIVTGGVGSADVRAMPLEFGNRTTGALDYPHFGPAMDEIEPRFTAAMAAVPIVAAHKTRGGGRGFIARLFGRRGA